MDVDADSAIKTFSESITAIMELPLTSNMWFSAVLSLRGVVFELSYFPQNSLDMRWVAESELNDFQGVGPTAAFALENYVNDLAPDFWNSMKEEAHVRVL